MTGQGSRPKRHYPITYEPLPANTDHVKRKFLNIPYASLSQSHKLDIYLPGEGEGPFPVIIYIHGGPFMGGDEADLLDSLPSDLASQPRCLPG